MSNSKFLPDGPGFITDETGFTIPLIAGGSDNGGVTTGSQVEQMLNAQQGEPAPEENEPEEPPVEEEEEEEEEKNFNGQTFLESIEDEEVRNRVAPVIKKWDAGVTRRFQELQSQLKPYKELGDYEQLEEAKQLYQIINERPEDLYRGLAEALGYGDQQSQLGHQVQPGPQGQNPYGQQPQGQQSAGGQTPQGMTPQQQVQYAQLPPEIQKQIQQQGQITEQLAEAYLNDQKTKQQQQEDQELDEYIGNLKEEFGDFDEDYVLTKMLKGMSGDKAVKAYQKAVRKNQAASNAANAPSVLSGGGQVPQDEAVDVGKISNKDTKKLVEGLIAQAAQSGD